MPHVLQPSENSENQRFRLTLNSDGRSHPLENTLAICTFVLGLVAFAATFFPGGHVVASWAGTLGFGVGLYSQYISATTAQRSLNVVGLVASFVGVALGIARGGFLP
ncbi:hypothetical protein [Thermoactinospora rubra]|uniref:hypothetical protein n=1 Tax=Thermoactinospora rubra TaxID=1088767 RepID=UPI000A1053D0|nr:hypothetical protein [Thermoactinospora rubra]